MFETLQKLLKLAVYDYEKKTREEWVLAHASQVTSL